MGALGELKKQLIAERGMECESCRQNAVWHAAHVFINTSKRYRKYTDQKYNIALVCLICHGFDKPNDVMYKYVDTSLFRVHFMKAQINRYGADAMRGWLETFPQKAKLSDEWREAALNFRYIVEGA